MSNTTIMNNSGIDGLDFSGMSLLGKHIKTNLGNSGIVIKEWLCYPEPCEWLLDTGYVLNEAQMYSQNEKILEVFDEKLSDSLGDLSCYGDEDFKIPYKDYEAAYQKIYDTLVSHCELKEALIADLKLYRERLATWESILVQRQGESWCTDDEKQIITDLLKEIIGRLKFNLSRVGVKDK